MKSRPYGTITLVLLSLTVTILAPAFDSSVYGLNGHPTEWLSFLPSSPLRHMGAGLLFSPFIHLSAQHLMINMALFVPIALMMERKKSAFLLVKHFFLIHFLVLLMLIAWCFFTPLSGKAFLGSSHIVVGLYTFWALANKKFGLLFFPVFILVGGLWQSQAPLTQLAHLFGAVSGIVVLFLSRLWCKLCFKSAN